MSLSYEQKFVVNRNNTDLIAIACEPQLVEICTSKSQGTQFTSTGAVGAMIVGTLNGKSKVDLLRVVDINSGQRLLEQRLSKYITYRQLTATFHAFVTQYQVVGLNFLDHNSALVILNAITSRYAYCMAPADIARRSSTLAAPIIAAKGSPSVSTPPSMPPPAPRKAPDALPPAPIKKPVPRQPPPPPPAPKTSQTSQLKQPLITVTPSPELTHSATTSLSPEKPAIDPESFKSPPMNQREIFLEEIRSAPALHKVVKSDSPILPDPENDLLEQLHTAIADKRSTVFSNDDSDSEW